MLNNRFLVAFAILAGAITPSAKVTEMPDSVQLRGGKTQDLTIEDENWDAVVGKGSDPIPWDDVLGIEYAEADAEFTKAIGDFNAGNYDLALGQFEVLLGDSKLRKVLKQQVAFDMAYALQMKGQLDEAIDAYQGVLQDYPKGRYHVRALENLAACMVAKEDPAGALKAVEGFQAEAAKDGGLAVALGLVKARLLSARNDHAGAKPLFDAATNAKDVPAWVGFEGQLGQATGLLQEGKASEAQARFQALTLAAAPKHVLSGAWNGLGDILSDQGFKKKDIDQLFDALYCYLRGSTVYAPITGEPTDQYERSLAGSVRCFGHVADLIDGKQGTQNAQKKDLYKQRAKERREVLEREFPSSPFLKNL